LLNVPAAFHQDCVSPVHKDQFHLPSEMHALFEGFGRGGCGRSQVNMSNQKMVFQI
jgi:hypothetical protein